ncbi:hypothetical protein [Pseudozobellia sp. WGM2]|uniref:hypothetical protein n=1 Tax=Pseudozobellia sp. WGM2 TaxID=2787625 RepID=UPI001AE010C7|nr:hypothetical protein [Pseudozobellia sp. WGM2]
MCQIFVGRGRKGQAALSPLVLSRGSEGVGKPERKDFPAGGRSVSVWGGLEWKGFSTSVGAWT